MTNQPRTYYYECFVVVSKNDGLQRDSCATTDRHKYMKNLWFAAPDKWGIAKVDEMHFTVLYVKFFQNDEAVRSMQLLAF